jgi:uncharacterized membrane protein YfcA
MIPVIGSAMIIDITLDLFGSVGFEVVPALLVLLNLPLAVAIGISLFVISINTTSGFIARHHTPTMVVGLL